MGVLDRSKGEFQFNFKIGPTLEKYATVAFEDQSRKVFEFDRVHTREITRSLRQATEGVQGIKQLPQLFLIGLVSEYDVFLHRLIRAGLMVQQGIISKIDRSLSLKELRQFPSIEDASEYLIEREIDSILHDHHYDQLVAIGNLFNLKIDMKDRCVKDFLEICERRNLFTHNAGVVNTRYLTKCKEYGIDAENVTIGDALGAGNKYYRAAISTTHELSIKLTQFIWRKLVPSDRDVADVQLIDAAFELLKAEDFSLAERILSYGLSQTGANSELNRRIMIINYALAIKRGGDKPRALAEIEKVDWSATSRRFQIAVAALKDDVKGVVDLMPLVAKDEVDEEEFRSWPVFHEAREEKIFQEKFKKVFSSELISTPALVASSVLNQSGEESGPALSEK